MATYEVTFRDTYGNEDKDTVICTTAKLGTHSVEFRDHQDNLLAAYTTWLRIRRTSAEGYKHDLLAAVGNQLGAEAEAKVAEFLGARG